MLDLGFVRANLELVEAKLRTRGADPAALLGDFRALDKSRREAITMAERLRAQLNDLSAQSNVLRRRSQEGSSKIRENTALIQGLKELIEKTQTSLNSGQDVAAVMAEIQSGLSSALANADSANGLLDMQKEISSLTAEARKLKEESEALQKTANALDAQIADRLSRIPNLTRDEVPVGLSEADNKVVKTWGEQKKFDFDAKPHWEIGEALGILDLERASKWKALVGVIKSQRVKPSTELWIPVSLCNFLHIVMLRACLMRCNLKRRRIWSTDGNRLSAARAARWPAQSQEASRSAHSPASLQPLQHFKSRSAADRQPHLQPGFPGPKRPQ